MNIRPLAAFLLAVLFAVPSLAQSPFLGQSPRPLQHTPPYMLPNPQAENFQWYSPQDRYVTWWRHRFGEDLVGPFAIPPVPPVLGEPLDPHNLTTRLPSYYPRSLALHVGQPYYMAYGNLLLRDLLSVRRTDQIEHHRTTGLQLLDELREQLSRLPNAPADVRTRILADFALFQNPRLVQWEAEAEAIRRDLTLPGVLRTTADDPGLMPTAPGQPDPTEAQVLARAALSAAHFQDGLSPDQRRLLEEISLEARLSDGSAPATATPGVFFWPAGARIPPPASLPPEIAARWDEFQRLKAGLKEELRALTRQQGFLFTNRRTEAYARLAADQAPRFAALEALADAIRPGLATRPGADQPAASNLPEDLTRRVGEIIARRTDLQRELGVRLKQFRSELPKDRVELVRQNNGLAITLASPEGTGSSGKTRADALARMQAINADLAAQYAALAADRDAVRTAIQRYQDSVPGEKPGLSVDQMAANFLQAYHEREALTRHRDYAAAVLTPGLSPAQRRLLFAAARADFIKERLAPAP